MCQGIESFELNNFAQIGNVQCRKTGNINLFIGENGTGKSTLLKALYTAVRTAEVFGRGDSSKTFADALADNLKWTFQVDSLGDLVAKGSDEPLSFKAQLGNASLEYSLTSSTNSKIRQSSYTGSTQQGNSAFIPAKEILSLQSIIFKSREIDQVFGFDNTYLDLARALRSSVTNGKDAVEAIKRLGDLMDGKIEFDEKGGRWIYKKGNAKYSINVTSEGIKKIATLQQLLANGYITDKSILFLDEPEASLHPTAISTLLEVVDMLANELGIQVFIASHSYFVIKKLRILAMRSGTGMPCISLAKDGASYYDLAEGMPENSIIQESVNLYDEEIEEVLG